MKPEITLLHVVGGAHIGYGRMGIYIAKEMREQGITVYDSIKDGPGSEDDEAVKMLTEYGLRKPGITNVVGWASVPTHAQGWWDKQLPVIMTMWEAVKLPEDFRQTLHEFDTVIVPSQHNLELFGKYHPNVKYVPLGVDPMRWHYQARPTLDNRFNFLTSGAGERKGVDLAIKAFMRVFPDGAWGDGPVPYLQIKALKPIDAYHPRIERVIGLLEGEDEANLYGQAHCYLQPSRGEGFGLQPLQAIAQGLPTILTAAHGHASFAHLGMGLSSELTTAGYFIYGNAGEWWEPDFDELCDTMWYVYHNYEEAALRAKINAQKLVDEGFTWDVVAGNFVDAIGMDKLLTPYKGTKTWTKPSTKYYKVVTNKDIVSDIGGTIYRFVKGEERWVPADVKRIMFDSGALELTNVDEDDHGLLPEQLERLPHFRFRGQYCTECHQRYGSGVTMIDEIMAGEIDPEDIAIRGFLPPKPVHDHTQ